METLPATQDDSSGANPSSIKSDDSSPGQNSGRGSPPPNCAICLGTCRNKSFTDSCLHQFCFKCLLTWSKVKAVCPLCKQNFRSIIHNVRSNDQYEEYMVEQGRTEDDVVDRFLNMDAFSLPTRRFRYRTTFTLPRRETIAIQQLLLHYPLVAEAYPRAAPPRRRRSPASFRRTVYRHNLWARPLPDFTGRFRDCSPEFYRYNETQMHRLVPWLDRELHYLLNENLGHISYVLNRIMELLRQYHINSPEFRDAMRRYFGDRTEHFLHELYCFASTPYDMTGYDRNVQYTTDTRISTMVNEVISSSDSEGSGDSDIMMVSSSAPAEAPAGPSRLHATPAANLGTAGPVPAPSYPHNYIPTPVHQASVPPPPAQNVIPIETILHSDSDDDSSEVMVVGYIKPPQERTPEVVDLLGSDSDVVVQESPPPQRSPEPERPRLPVKLSMKLHRPREEPKSDSDDSYRPPTPPVKRRRTALSGDAATTSDTCRPTPSPAVSSASVSQWDVAGASSSFARSWSSSSSSSSFSSDITSSTYSDTSSSDEDSSWSGSYTKKKKASKRKSQKKISKDHSAASRSRERYKKRTQNTRHKTKKDKRSKHKSHSGKGVKSSKKPHESNEALIVSQTQTKEELPGSSGTVTHQKRRSRDKPSRKPRQTGEDLIPVQVQDYEESQPGPSYLSTKMDKEKPLKKSKDSNDPALSEPCQNEQASGCSGTSAQRKEKNNKEKTKKCVAGVCTSASVNTQPNEEQQPGPSCATGSHKVRTRNDKTSKKSREPSNGSTHTDDYNNEDQQPGPSGISSNHKPKSSKEKSSKKHDNKQESGSAHRSNEEKKPVFSGTSEDRCITSRDRAAIKFDENSPSPMDIDEEQQGARYKHKSSRDRKRRRHSREKKRLKSVVNIMYSNNCKNAGEANLQRSPGGISNTSSSQYDNLHNDNTSMKLRYDSSDSEDDLPLNLTIQNSLTYTQL